MKEAGETLRQLSPAEMKRDAATQAFYQHAHACDDPDTKLRMQFEVLCSFYGVTNDGDTKGELMEKAKRLLRERLP